MTVVELEQIRTCRVCGFDLPLRRFRHGAHDWTSCDACLPNTEEHVHQLAETATALHLENAVRALRRLGLTIAATRILAGARPWPRLSQAYAMQAIPRQRGARR